MRMIDRWFPCTAVSDASYQTYGSGRVEKSLFTWFAARPIAQARAAVLTTLLPWPEDRIEQRRLQDLVTRAVGGDPRALNEAAIEVHRAYPDGARVLDPFSGRAIIPLEATRGGAESWGIDYSPVATLAGMLLADFPFQDWSKEPSLPFGPAREGSQAMFNSSGGATKLAFDLRALLEEISTRQESELDPFYPRNVKGERPWGYFWAQTMPCDECKHHFPLIGSAVLRFASPNVGDPGASFSLSADRATGELTVVLHEGVDAAAPTLLSISGKRGKIARCPFCNHPHIPDVIKAKANAGLLRDKLLLVADISPTVGPSFRLPTVDDLDATLEAERALHKEPSFIGGIPAVPDELIPAGNNDTVRASLYGVRTYGGMCCARQTLSFVRLCRIVAGLKDELSAAGCSDNYIRALLGYAGSVIVRKLRRSTRGATLLAASKQVDNIFKNQASLNYGFDFFETGIGTGAGTWRSMTSHTLNVVEKLNRGVQPAPARVRQGSALHLPFRPKSVTAVVTDPPYYNMIDYSDASDLFFVWLKRALGGVFPELFDTNGVQNKDEEIIVKRGGTASEHRTSEFYTKSLKAAFVSARSILRDDGALTLVFGHGDPEAWRLLLSALTDAGFVVTGSWPARTEESTAAGAANIAVTITIACRPAPVQRRDGLQVEVDLEVEKEIRARIVDWERDALALTDQLMAAYGPTMEVIGRYERVLRPDGTLVEIDHYLSLARRTVQDVAAIKVDGLPLETFDARTRFALFWARLYGRQIAPKSEAVFQAMASNLQLNDVRKDILEESTKGYRLASFAGDKAAIGGNIVTTTSTVIDVVRQMVPAWRNDGGEGVAMILGLSERDPDDAYLWAVITYLAGILPAADADRKSLEDIMRNRAAIISARSALARDLLASQIIQTPLFRDDTDSGVPPAALGSQARKVRR